MTSRAFGNRPCAWNMIALSSLGLIACSSSDSDGRRETPDTSGTTESYELSMDSIEVPPGGELYKCQDFVNPFGKDVAIVWSKSVMSPGSHHFAAFRIEGLTTAGLTDCPAGGLEAHEFVHASQTPEQETPYPEGVGRFLPATDGLRLQVHYLNTSLDPLKVEAKFSVRYVDGDRIRDKAAGVFLNNLGLTVPPGKSTVTKSYALERDIKLLVAVSHMHRHATEFVSTTDDGQQLFESKEWDGPTPAAFSPALDLSAGTTITWNCSFENETGATLTFGESASKNEMCIFNGVYYPAPDGSSITQNLW
jgi:hypothetical protein